MSDDQMHDADLSYTIPPLQENNTSPSPTIDTAAQTPEPPLPAYADPSFYLTQQPQPPYTPEPEPTSSSTQKPNKATPLPRHQWTPRRRVSPYWRMVGQLPLQYWRVLTRPGIVTFYMEESKASWSGVWTQVLGFAALNALIIIGTMLVTNFIEQQSMQHLSAFHLPAWTFLQYSLIAGSTIGLFAAITTILGYFFNAAAIYFFARIFGGRATFLEHCYCTALIVVPIWIITHILSFALFFIHPALPLHITSAIGTASFIYKAILQVVMIMAIHRLNWPAAVAAVIIAMIILSSGILPFIPIPQ
jgi:hypothetical protein